MVKREDRAAKKQREDQALNRVLWWFGGAVLLEFALLLLNRFYINFDAGGQGLAYALARLLRTMIWVCLGGTVACGCWWLVRRRKGKATFLPGACTMICGALFLCAVVSSLWPTVGVPFLYLSVPAAAVLALIYYLYQREFFLVAVQGAAALFAMWSYRKVVFIQASAAYVILAVCAVAVLALGTLTRVLQTHGGKLGKKQLLSKNTNYAMLYAAGVITLCALLMALLLGVTAAYVALFFVVAWLFGAAVYYTVRLM